MPEEYLVQLFYGYRCRQFLFRRKIFLCIFFILRTL